MCYGQTVSRTTYAVLFAVIGTTYGAGDGSSTFALPDMRGRTIAGVDNMGGSDASRLDWANTLGTTGGTQTHTLATTEIPAHLHSIDPPITTSSDQSQSHLHSVDPPLTNTGYMSANASHNHNTFYNSDPRAGSLGGDMIAYGSDSNMAWRTVYPGAATTDTNHYHSVDIAAFNSANANQGHTHTTNIAAFDSANTGGGGAHNNMQPTMLMNYIIKT